MRRERTSFAMIGSILVCGALALAGCTPSEEPAKPAPKPEPAPTPPVAKVVEPEKEVVKVAPKPEALPPDLVEVKAEIARAKAQLDLTVAKLEMLAASTGDLDKPSQDALDAIKVLDTESQGLKKRGDDMRVRGAAYFEAWEKQLAEMSTPEVQAIASKRKDELSKVYAGVLTAMQEARAAFDPLWSDLEAIQKSIEDGMTPEKVKELGPPAQKVKEAATKLKDRIDAVYAKVDQVAAIYTRP